MSWISARDVAEIAVRCLGDRDAIGQTMELGGKTPVMVFDDFDEESRIALQMYVAEGAVIDMDRVLQRFPVALTPIREHLRGSL